MAVCLTLDLTIIHLVTYNLIFPCIIKVNSSPHSTLSFFLNNCKVLPFLCASSYPYLFLSHLQVRPIKPDLLATEKKTFAYPEIKEMTAETISDKGLLDVPPSTKIQKEWTCPICQVTTTSEAVFISHLQGRRHAAASEKLKANQMLQNKNSPASVERSAPKEMAAAVVADRDFPIKLPSENVEEWNCPICQVKTSSQTVFISHLQGMRHDAASKKLKYKNQISQSNTSAASVETEAPEKMATAGGGDLPDKSPSKSIHEWTCPICQITTPSETIFISHLQGSQHEDASEKLK